MTPADWLVAAGAFVALGLVIALDCCFRRADSAAEARWNPPHDCGL